MHSDQIQHVPATTSSSASFRASQLKIDAPARVACVVDFDNVCSRRGKYGKRAWACLDVVRFVSALRERGVSTGTVCQNDYLGVCGSKLWTAAGFRSVATGQNVDDTVKLVAATYALEGLDWLVLVASDGGYAEIIKIIRDCKIRVEVWALREAAARPLLYVADSVRWIDDFVVEPSHRPTKDKRSSFKVAA